MKQFQFAYINDIKLKNDINRLKAACAEIESPKVLIQMFTETGEPEDIEAICAYLDEEMPEAEYVGCSTNGNILDGEWTLAQIMITATVFEKATTRFEIIGFNAEMVDPATFGDTLALMHEKDWLKSVGILFTFNDREDFTFQELVNNTLTEFVVFGGGALNANIKSSDIFVLTKKDGIIRKGIVLLLLGGPDFYVETTTVLGWKPLGKRLNITRTAGTRLYELDDAPAYRAYSNYLNIRNDEFFGTNCLEFPLLCHSPEGYELLRTPVRCNPDGSIEMFSQMNGFDSVRLTYGDPTTILNNVHKSTEAIKRFAPDVIQIFSCASRKAFWDRTVSRETLPYQSIAPTFGYYSSGELVSENGRINLHNETLVIVSMREGLPKTTYDFAVQQPSLVDKGRISLNSRLVNFIQVSTAELVEANNNLDDLLKEVETKREEADAANQAKSEFLANMSHEIRTPINAILGFDTMILRECHDANITKYAMDIQSSGENLLSLINDILDLSKVESGRMEIVPNEYELGSLINDIVNMVSFRAKAKGLEVQLDVDPNIPAWLFGDDVRIRQVILNLLNNAVKYTESGWVKLTVKGDSIGAYEILHIAISDSGVGIKDEDMANLFEKFRRVETKQNHKIEGTGLGMTITANLLNLMDTSIQVESEYGKGSVFHFDLRQGIVRRDPVGDLSARFTAHKEQFNYVSLFTAPEAHILLVDDNAINRSVIANLLKETKVQITEADGGLKFLERTAERKYDLVLLDHMMPDLDGVEAFHRLKEMPDNPNYDTPVIILTANAITGAKEEYLAEGFTNYLSKPVVPDKLEAMLRDYLPEDKINVEMVEAVAKEDTAAIEDIEIPEVEGLDADYALLKLTSKKIVVDTMKLFGDTYVSESEKLKEFCEDIRNAESEEALTAAFASYRIKVHAMKSTAATIGGIAVSGLARFLEFAARDQKKTEILTITDSFLAEWNALGLRVRECFVTDELSELADFDAEVFKEKLPKLQSSLEEMDIDTADAILAELKTFELSDEISAEIEKLTGAVYNIDLAEADAIVQKILSML